MRRIGLIVLGLLLFAPAHTVVPQSTPEPSPLAVTPEKVAINLNYRGADLVVHANVPPGCAAAVRLLGRRERLILKQKGKRFGLIWMTAGEVVFDDVPIVYQAITSVPLAKLAPPQVLAENMLGCETVIAEAEDSAAWRAELVKLKQQQGLYQLTEKALVPTAVGTAVVSTTNSAEPATPLVGTMHLPALAPPGEYDVTLLTFRNGQAKCIASTTVRVERTGVVRAVHQLAFEHGLLYGCIAVLAAVVAGLLCGLLFQSKSDAGH